MSKLERFIELLAEEMREAAAYVLMGSAHPTSDEYLEHRIYSGIAERIEATLAKWRKEQEE